jgi:Ca-activated chloride channel family protein
LKLPSNRTHLCFFCALLVVCFHACFLVWPLPFVSSGALVKAQQTPSAGAQTATPTASTTYRFFVTVTDRKGGFVSGLTKEEFAVWEGKTQSEINYFSSDAPPASIGVLLDVSRSTSRRDLDAERYAAARFIQQSYTNNEYFIGEFNTELRVLTDWTRDVPALEGGLKRLALTDAAQQKPKTRGLTALYDACAVALDKVAQGAHAKRVLLLLTDGRDTISRLSSDAVRRKVKNSDVLVYSISFIENNVFPDVEAQRSLDELTLASGGRAFFVQNMKELEVVVERIALELRQQYVLGFTHANAERAGKWNKVKIKVTPLNKSLKDLLVRSREGYFSPLTTP